MTTELKNTEELNQALLTDEYVIVDFYTANCVPCKILAPVFDLVSTKYPAIKFYKYNADNLEDVERFNIKAVPSILFFKKNEELKRMVGIKSQQHLENMVQVMVDVYQP